MLVRFAVTNFRSVRERQELSLVASPALKEDITSILPTPITDVSALPVSALYGANASGKTNVLRGLNYMRYVVCASQAGWKPSEGTGRQPFRLDRKSAANPSEFDVDVVIDGIRYAYEFAVSDSLIVKEELTAYPRGRPQLWFVRNGSEIRFGKQFSGENKSIWSLTRPNSLFLSAAAQNNHKLTLPIYNWFSRAIRFAHPDNKAERLRQTLLLAEEERGRSALLKLLGSADLGIVGIRVGKREPTEKQKQQVKQVFDALRAVMPELSSEDVSWGELSSMVNAQLLHKVAHDSNGVALPLEAESDGTRSLFALGRDLVETLSCGGLLCVDELEDGLHPLVALEIVKLFSDPARNPHGAQLVFTTHNTTLLARRLLRRDQVWFTEKSQEGATRLYALTDFQPRRDENRETGYLQGRYGAIPFLDNPFPADFADNGASCGEAKE